MKASWKTRDMEKMKHTQTTQLLWEQMKMPQKRNFKWVKIFIHVNLDKCAVMKASQKGSKC
jgi:ribonuclease HI